MMMAMTKCSQQGEEETQTRNRINLITYLGLGFQGRLPVCVSESLHDRFIVIGRSIQKLAAQGRLPKNLLPAICILVDVLSK